MTATLRDLAEKYGCDKLHSHSYIPVYERLFQDRQIKRLLEIGIGYRDLMEPFVPKYVHGASLKMWRDYFTDAQVFGCDIREDVLFHDEERITTCHCNQTDPVGLLFMVGKIGTLLDIIIDDGSHETEDHLIPAVTLWPYLRRGGLYIIEDVRDPAYLRRELNHLGGLIVHQSTKRPDDCMMVIEK